MFRTAGVGPNKLGCSELVSGSASMWEYVTVMSQITSVGKTLLWGSWRVPQLVSY